MENQLLGQEGEPEGWLITRGARMLHSGAAVELGVSLCVHMFLCVDTRE